MIKELRSWLADVNYETGMRLYRKYFNNATVLQTLEALGDCDFSISRLESVFGEKVEALEESSPLIPLQRGTGDEVNPVQRGVVGKGEGLNEESSPLIPLQRGTVGKVENERLNVAVDYKIYDKLKRESSMKYAEASRLREKLFGNIDVEDRKVIAFRVLEIMRDEFPKLRNRVEYYKKTGVVLDNPLLVKKEGKDWERMRDAERMKWRNNLRSYISKYKKNPLRQSDVEQWQSDLMKIEKLLAR